jgi:triacylglycerol esterase/lipase EstA (alpha/beta hydrolase family)
MLKLLMEQNAQLKEMEAEMEKLVKEKEQLKPMEFIPLNSIPISGVSTTSVTKVSSDTPLISLEKAVDLAKSMEKMNLQETKINRLKKEIENLQELKSSFQISLSKEKQVTDHLKQDLQQLRKQTVAGKTLAKVKESVWTDITKSMNEIWPMI